MSHRATVWAIDQKLPALAKLVLLILADRHNGDTNRCDPSMERVAADCGMSRDSVRRQVKALVDKGLIEVHSRREGTINLTNFFSFKMQQMTPPPANSTHPLPSNSTPNQEVLNQEVKTTPAASKSTSPKFRPPAWIDGEAWEGYLEVRRHKRAVMTERALSGVVRRLEQFRAGGHDPNAILETSVRSSWADVYEPKPGDHHEKGNHPQQFRPVAAVREEENLAALQRVVQRELQRAEAGGYRAGGYALGDGDERGDE